MGDGAEPRGGRDGGRKARDAVPVSSPGDRHEVDAARAAGQSVPAGATTCSRCATGASCSSCGRRSAARAGLVPDAGVMLPPDLRASVEGQLGPVGDVRVHTGAPAARAAGALRAEAYAYGRSIVFADGAYAPGTPAGFQLLLHEARHTQQDPGGAMVHRQPDGGDGAVEPSLDDVVADPSLFTDEMIDELLGGQSAVDARDEQLFDLSMFDVTSVDNADPSTWPVADDWSTGQAWDSDYDLVGAYVDSLPVPQTTTPSGTSCSSCHTPTEPAPPPPPSDTSCSNCHTSWESAPTATPNTPLPMALGSAPMTEYDAIVAWIEAGRDTPPSSTSDSQCSSCHTSTEPVPTTFQTPLSWPPEPWYGGGPSQLEADRPTDEEIDGGEDVLWELGPRGEHIPIDGYTGQLRSKYTKPYAIIAAEAGNYQFAELAENYMCPTCHIIAQVGHMPTDREFFLGGYVHSYESNYVGLLNSNPGSAGWNFGVGAGELLTGESSGLNLNEVMMGEAQMGRELSGSERAWRGFDTAVGLLTLGRGARGSFRPSPTIRPTFAPPRLVYSGPGRTTPSTTLRTAPAGQPYVGGNAAPNLAPRASIDPVVAQAPRHLSLVPDAAPGLPVTAPRVSPWSTAAPWVFPYSQTSSWANLSPQPQPQPDDDQQPGWCPRGGVIIRWPSPVWTGLGYGDSGATSGLWDFPPSRLLSRTRSPTRDRAMRNRYVRNNIAALAPRYYTNRRGNQQMNGAIHHKVPLFLGGTAHDVYDNLVYLDNTSHQSWHNTLALQGRSGWMIRDPYGTLYCAT